MLFQNTIVINQPQLLFYRNTIVFVLTMSSSQITTAIPLHRRPTLGRPADSQWRNFFGMRSTGIRGFESSHLLLQRFHTYSLCLPSTIYILQCIHQLVFNVYVKTYHKNVYILIHTLTGIKVPPDLLMTCGLADNEDELVVIAVFFLDQEN